MLRIPDPSDDPRRRFLLKALAAGVFASASLRRAWGMGDVFGRIPQPLPEGKSIYEIGGTLKVNGTVADDDTLVHAGDTLETDEGSHAVFVVGKDAFILRENSRVGLSGEGGEVDGIHVETGALLSVFAKRVHVLTTPLVSVGIRGTGVYVESEPDRSYVCTCYGTTELVPSGDSGAEKTGEREVVSATHHSPRYVLAGGEKRIREAPFKDHSDFELTLIEALVGRIPPFSMYDNRYGTPNPY